MGVEAQFDYIGDLNPDNPPGSDKLLEVDNHLRGIKSSVKGSFPSLGQEAVTATAAQINATCARYDAATKATQVPWDANITFQVGNGGPYDISMNVDASFAGSGALVVGGYPLLLRPKAGQAPVLGFDVSESGRASGYGNILFYNGASQAGAIGMDANGNIFFRQGGTTIFFSQILAGLQAAGVA